MFQLFLTWAICGIANTAVAQTSSTEIQREWTDASGTRRACATLLRLEGERLWLQRASGRLTTTTLQNLSKRDRQYVASRRPGTNSTQSRENSESLNFASAAAETFTNTVETIRQLPNWLAENQDATASPAIPAALVYVRVSREFLEDYVERNVIRRKPLRDCVLGARIRGESETRGRTRLTLLPSSGQLLGSIAFDGTVHASTTGRKGSVILHNRADSTFHARKMIAMGNTGVRVGAATATATTNLTLIGVDSTLPRLLGRIAKRIGWHRALRSHGQAQLITADHTADDIREDFDDRINRTMSKVQHALGSKIPELETGRNPVPTDVRFRSSQKYVEIGIFRENASTEERKIRPRRNPLMPV